MNFIIFPLTYRMQIFNNFTTNFVVMTIPPAMLQCRFNSSSNKPQSNQRKWWKCLVSTLKLMKIQFLFPSNRQMSFSLSSAKGTDPYDQVQFPILNSHEKCKLFLQDISVTKGSTNCSTMHRFLTGERLNLREGQNCIKVRVSHTSEGLTQRL